MLLDVIPSTLIMSFSWFYLLLFLLLRNLPLDIPGLVSKFIPI